MKHIIITIDPMGKTRIEANGYAGDACLKATRDMERVLGKVKRRNVKREYFTPQRRFNRQQLKNT